MKKILFLLLLGIYLICRNGFPVISITAGPEVILDGIDSTITRQFDTANAVFCDSLLITSMEDGAYIPSNYRYPVLKWQTPENTEEVSLVEIKSSHHSLRIFTRNNSWQPEGDQFQRFLYDPVITITVYRKLNAQIQRSGPVQIKTAGALSDSIVYRVVPPLFDTSAANSIKLFSFNQRNPVDLVQLEGACLGCHTYAPELSLFNIKKDKDRRLILFQNLKNFFEQKVIGEFSF